MDTVPRGNKFRFRGYLGSRTLQNFDAALVGYTFAVLFSTFAIVYRYAMWLPRPPFWTIAPALVEAWGSKQAISDG
jgi:hypothetical protein